MKKYCLIKPKITILGVGIRPFDKEKKMVLVGKEIVMCMNCGLVYEILKDGTLRQLYNNNYLIVDDKTVTDFDNLPEIKNLSTPVEEENKPEEMSIKSRSVVQPQSNKYEQKNKQQADRIDNKEEKK